MRRLVLFCLIGTFVMTSTVVYAQEKAPLGKSNLALKFDYIAFTDNHFDEPFNEDDGLYLGLEGYGEIIPNWYLGGEIGAAININLFGDHISFVPVEVNVKYAKEAAPNLVVDFGGGLSYSYAKLEVTDWSHPSYSGNTVYYGYLEREDWLLGGQIFADLTYKIGFFSIGLNGKYQITQDFKDEGIDLNNGRVGLQLGILF